MSECIWSPTVTVWAGVGIRPLSVGIVMLGIEPECPDEDQHSCRWEHGPMYMASV